MNRSLYLAVAALTAAGLAAASAVATAQSRSATVVRPAVISAPATPTPVAFVSTTGDIKRRGIIIVTPTPLPPPNPNSCFRGNSSGVSRC